MIAIGGGVFFVGYWLGVWSIGQIMGQNYGLLSMVWPSSWAAVLANPPAPDTPGPNQNLKQTTSPCTKAQTKAGWVASSQGGCVPPQQVTKSPCTKAQLAKGWIKTENGKCSPPNPVVTQSPPPGM